MSKKTLPVNIVCDTHKYDCIFYNNNKIIFPQYINAKLTALNTFVISYLLCGLTALTCSYVTINVTVNQTQVKLNKLTLLFMEHMFDVTRLSLMTQMFTIQRQHCTMTLTFEETRYCRTCK